MLIEVDRYSSGKESTLSIVSIDGVFECHGLEDEYRSKKVYGETRILDGTYKVGLRTVGGHHDRYKSYDFHKGMLHVLDVPEFEYILIHKGNDDDDTAGCLLLGDSVNNNKVKNGFIGSSADAYERFYQKVVEPALKGELVITYKSR